MRLLRLILSDLHLGTGIRRGELNPLEDFVHDETFAELLEYYDRQVGEGELELILNGDIFDLLKVKVNGVWPIDITEQIATNKLAQCLDGHPQFVRALSALLSKPRRRIVYIIGNHDLDMWFKEAQTLFRRTISPSEPETDRVVFIADTDTYYLPDGIQVRHGHQFERIHQVDYQKMTRKLADGREILDLPWGSLWILEVMNPAKEQRSYVDRVQPLSRFLLGASVLDTRFVLRFLWNSAVYFLRRRVFSLGAWRKRLWLFPTILREDILALFSGFDNAAIRALKRLRGVSHLIIGHSHGPRYMQVEGGKVLVNTGTWMKMINIDVRHLGQPSGLTYCTIEYDGQRPQVSLLRWFGQRRPFEIVPYAD